MLPSVEYSILTPLTPKLTTLSITWLVFQTHSSWSLYTLSNWYWIQFGCTPPLIHMCITSVECPSFWSRPEPLTVFSGPMPAWELAAVAVTFVIA